MSYLLFILMSYAIVIMGGKVGVTSIDNTTWLILAILTAGEVVSWRIKK